MELHSSSYIQKVSRKGWGPDTQKSKILGKKISIPSLRLVCSPEKNLFCKGKTYRTVNDVFWCYFPGLKGEDLGQVAWGEAETFSCSVSINAVEFANLRVLLKSKETSLCSVLVLHHAVMFVFLDFFFKTRSVTYKEKLCTIYSKNGTWMQKSLCRVPDAFCPLTENPLNIQGLRK